MSKIKVEIWSDVVCPFCYIGKRRFEHALEKFPNRNDVEIEWRSFQLDPEVKPVPGMSINEYLAKRKGVSVAEGKQMNDYMADMAKEVGLHYDFDKAVVTNTTNAHQLIQLAKKHQLGDKAEERFFAAYYTEGQDLNNPETLVKLAAEIGLDETESRQVLQNDTYKEAVLHDQYEAAQVGARGVPFFVFNNKYAISGAQPTETFLQALNQIWQETAKPQPLPGAGNGANACDLDGNNC